MLIHFVCTGNSYRSRLAGTYLNSKQIPNIKAQSSGTMANRNMEGVISWEAQRIIQNNNLTQYESHMWRETTKKLLDSADLVVFMQKGHYDYCKEKLGFLKTNFRIFDIKDIGDDGYSDAYISLENDIEKIKLTEKIYGDIQKKVDKLIKEITS